MTFSQTKHFFDFSAHSSFPWPWKKVSLTIVNPVRWNFCEIWIKIPTFSFRKIVSTMLFVAWGSLCLGLNVITTNRTFCESRCSQARRLLRRSRSNPSSWLRPASLCRNPTSSFCLCFSINACLISNCCFVRRWCVLRPRPVRPARISIGTGSERPDPVMDNGCLHIPEPDSYHSTVWCHYVNAVDFLPNPSRHAIAHPWGRVMKCRLYVKILIYVLPQLQQHVQCCRQYHVIFHWTAW